MNNEVKFTPGPWNVEKVTHRHAVVDDAQDGTWKLIAETTSAENAALIAAAPTLYSTLEFVLHDALTTNGCVLTAKALDAINYTLAKARGE